MRTTEKRADALKYCGQVFAPLLRLNLAVAVVMLSANLLVAQAVPNVWNGTGDGVDWADDNNWDLGLPGLFDAATIDNGDTVSISSDVGGPNAVLIADGDIVQTGGRIEAVGGFASTGSLSFIGTGGSYSITGGTAIFGTPSSDENGWASIGGDSNGGTSGNGVFNMSGTADVTFHNRLHVPRTGTGEMNVNGGTLNIHAAGGDPYEDGLAVGDSAGSVGTFNVTAGTVNVGGNARIGNWQGTGTLNVSGGSFSVIDTPGTVGELSVGSEADGAASGTVNHTGGTLATTELLIAQDNDSIGLYTINESDGPATLTVSGLTEMRGGAGTFNIEAGTVSLDETVVGVNAGTKSDHLLNISGGDVDIRTLEIARNGPGTLGVVGSAATIDVAEDFNFGVTGSGLATLNLGLDAGGLSAINVQNDANVFGTVNVDVLSGASITTGQVFDVIVANIGGFGSGVVDTGLVLDAGDVGNWLLIITADKVQIEALVDFSAGLPGDGNGDGWVDGLDYLLWAANFGDDPADDPPGSPGNGDYNDDKVVDGLDYLLWAGNFGTHNSTAVPEPGACVLVVMGALALLSSRRRQRLSSQST